MSDSSDDEKGEKEENSVQFDRVFADELTFIKSNDGAQPSHRSASDKLAGIALSGGGIRAASFSLGVMQALNDYKNPNYFDGHSLFNEFDYMSTVSGGGYAGASVTWFRHLAKIDPASSVWTESLVKEQEFVDDANEVIKKSSINFETYKAALSTFPKKGNGRENDAAVDALNFIRHRKNHLTPTVTLNFLSLAAVAFRTMLLSLPIYLTLLVLFFLVYNSVADVIAGALDNFPLISSYENIAGASTGCQIRPHQACKMYDCNEVTNFTIFVSFACVVIFLIWNVVFLTCSRLGRYHAWHYHFRRASQGGIGMLFLTMLALFCIWIATILGDKLTNDFATGIAIVFGNGIGALSFRSLLNGGKEKNQNRAKLVIICVAILLLIGNLTAAFEIADYILREFSFSNLLSYESWIFWVFLAMALSIAAGCWANLNYVSLNRMYRDRLMETFLPSLNAIWSGMMNKRVLHSDSSFLCNMAQRPYHLVNTHAVLTSSKVAKQRSRTGDNFLLSPLFCGSRATEYRETSNFGISKQKYETARKENEKTKKEKGKGGVTLATAMAISGAAFNPRVGPGGWDTPINNPIISSMLSYYNLRLGCWVSNPRRNKDKNGRFPIFYWEGIKGLLNLSNQENALMLELTDGGHFENTGLYELLARRTDLIVFSDATADGNFNFKDVGIAIERARVDLGVDVRFDNDDWDLTHVMPKSQDEEHYDRRYDLARRGYAIARIRYPSVTKEDGHTEETKVGYLFYVKAVMTRSLPTDLYGYRGAHPEFPHQPINDQMFDESQFEAYRELGYQITQKMAVRHGEQIRSFLMSDAGQVV